MMERVRSAIAWFIFVTAVSAQSQCLSLTSKFPDCVVSVPPIHSHTSPSVTNQDNI